MATTVRPLFVESAPRHVVSVRPASLTEDFDGLARRLLRSVSDLTGSERQFLKDFQRDRYSMTALEHFCDIAPRSPLMHHRFGAAEIVRAHIVRQASPLAIVPDQVWDAEDDSNSAFDKAMRRYEKHPTYANWQAAKEAGEQQLAATRAALDTLNAIPPKDAA